MSNTSYIDVKYINILGRTRLDQFKQSGKLEYRCRCPECGDSKKSKTKSRGYFYNRKNAWWYKCHNCGIPMSFSRFLERRAKEIHQEYLLEIFEAKGYKKKRFQADDFEYKSKPVVFNKVDSLNIPRVDQLAEDHIAVRYLNMRQIPKNKFELFYHTETFKEFVNSLVPDKYADTEFDERRLVIPFFDKDGNLIAFQGRSYKKNTPLRYITIKIDNSQPRIFGMERIDFKKQIYSTEGAFDSLFIPNCISFNGADIPRAIDPKEVIIIYDNDKRNKIIVKDIGKAIDRGFKIVLFPNNFKAKDINEMIVRKEIKKENILDFLAHNTYYGLEAKLKLADWMKV